MKDSSKSNGHKHTTETPDVSHIRNVEVTHEESDVSVSGVVTFAVALTILTAVVYVAMVFMFNYFQSQEAKEPAPGPMALSKKDRLPPEPRLQSSQGFQVTLQDGQKVNLELSQPQMEFRVLRQQWERDLAQGSKDSTGKLTGMPIDSAIQKVTEMNLPARVKGTQRVEAFAVSVPTAASSGRVTEQRLQ
jgi:hypothetical protein